MDQVQLRKMPSEKFSFDYSENLRSRASFKYKYEGAQLSGSTLESMSMSSSELHFMELSILKILNPISFKKIWMIGDIDD